MPPVRPSLLRPLVLAACLLAFVGTVQAQWIWRDRNGQITASDLPPPREVADKDIIQRPSSARRLPPPPAAASAASAPTAAKVDPVLEQRRRAAEQEQQSRLKVEQERVAQARAENCRRAKAQLAGLQSGQRIARLNEKGEREFLDDKGRAEESRRAEGIIASDCD
ncbi:DUF4124 domain-containing protein [Rubrivivax gelatinosus]|uniref:Uncharacterized protein DUF4124 n=1 Tax=Rubrivivax gelatinosus TaxID=28068 RepID=A0A4R2MEP3_RUBGE|nr:DUF4124 domain-containing protein [Rubrivivax gelatinosus]MBK1687620.1 DUF4124 domain-containing protein [Rubrivivax gelatinosus]TCP02994.1 uncharacterized protein DUF4124 [Rubrivivax gelatinosus]